MLPDPHPEASAALAAALRDVGYSEPAIVDLLGDDSYSSGPEDIPVHARRLDETPLGIAIRALFLNLPVSRGDAVRALGRRGVEALGTIGLADVGDELVPAARVLPVGELLIAADGYSRGAADRVDYVAAYSPTSRLCDCLTPRRRIARALDVGTGSGVQALLAARHARTVVATDVNERALRFARLNAALNGFDNIDFRHGSLFEPVRGETFDLVTCNAPYVVSPENRWAYRDSGATADDFSARVVAGAAEHLADGGHATLVVSWVAADEDEPDERVLEWTRDTGCDSWILVAWDHDPLEHAATWNDHLADDQEALEAALDEWTDYFDGLGVRWVSEGVVLLHRRTGGGHTARVDDIDEEEIEDASEQVRRAFEARERLDGLDLLETRISVATPLTLEYEVEPRRTGRGSVCLAAGTCSCVDASPAVLDVLAGLNGRAKLRSVVGSVARRRKLPEAAAARMQRDTVRVIRELLELGALRAP